MSAVLAVMLAGHTALAQPGGQPNRDNHDNHDGKPGAGGGNTAQPGRPGEPTRPEQNGGAKTLPGIPGVPALPGVPQGGQPQPGLLTPPRAGKAGTPADHAKDLDQQQQKDRAARSATRKDPAAWTNKRPERAQEHRQEVATEWGAAAASPAGKAELQQHGERIAKLNRVVDVAEDDKNTALVARAQVAITKENARHAAAMAQIQTKEGAR